MGYVEVHVDLDDFETDELVSEVVRRFKTFGRKKLTDKQKEELKDSTIDLYKSFDLLLPEGLSLVSLEDKMKFDVIKEYWSRYTSWQLEQKLKP